MLSVRADDGVEIGVPEEMWCYEVPHEYDEGRKNLSVHTVHAAEGSGTSPEVVEVGGMTSAHSLTHMYLENDTYNQRNHTSWDECCCMARKAVLYSIRPDTATGTLASDGGGPIGSRANQLATWRSSFARRGATSPMYLWTRGTVIRVWRRGGGIFSLGGKVDMRCVIPFGREM